MINKSIPFCKFAPEKGSGMAREWSGIASALPRKLFALLFCLLFVGVGAAWADWTLCTSASDFAANNYYMFVSDANSTHYYLKAPSTNKSAGSWSSSTDTCTAYSSDPTTLSLKEAGWKLVAGASSGQWKLTSNRNSSTYLYATNNNNGLASAASGTASSYWTITKHSTNNTFKFTYYSQGRSISPYTGASPYGLRSYTSAQYVKVYKWNSCTPINPSVSYSSTTIYKGDVTSAPTITGNTGSATITWTSSDPTVATVNSSGVVTALKAGTTTIKAAFAATGDYCSKEVSTTFTIRYRVKWSVNGNDSYTTGSPTTYIGTHNTKVSTLPTDPTSAMCDNTKVFVGWTTSSYSHATNAPTTLFLTAASSPNVTDNVTYYAVFANRTDFTRVTSTSQLAAGKQIVVVDDQNSKVLTTAPGYATAPTESSSKITPSNNMIWTLEANSTNWKLKTSGSYLGASGTSNGTAVSLTSTNSIWNIAASSGATNTFYLQNTAKDKLCLEYYSSGSSWVVYANNSYTSSTYFTERLYVATLTNYATTCCTALGSINGSISMSSSTDGTVTISGWTYNAGSTGTTESNVSSYTVKLYKWNGSAWAIANASSTTGGSSGTAATRTGIATDSKSVTYSGLEYGGTYKFTVQPIGNGSSYCDGEETAVTSINGNSLTDNKFINKYSIYIDDATDDNYAHNYITSISSHAGSVDITLLANKDYYQYKLSLGGVVWWGNTGKMTSANCSSWTFTDGASNCKLQTNLGGTYTFALAAGTPAISVTYPPDDQASGKNIYFDNSILEWSDIFYRVGSGSTNVKEDFTLVAGTDNFYYTTTPEKSDISAWHIANNTGWTGSNDIYKTKTGDDYAITKSIAFQQYVVTGHMTIIPTTTSSKGSEDKNNNCDFYTINTPTSGMLTHTATITTPSHGTITISNTDQSLSATSTTANLPHRTILTITATPDDGYSLSSLTVNAADFTSGSTHILAADATIAATFTANKYDVTLKPTSQTGSVTDQVVQATYDAAMPTTVKTAGTAIVIPERTGYSFTGWFDNSIGGKQYYQYTGSPKTLSSANPWDKTSATNLYAQWSINSYTLTWATVRGKVTTAGTGADVNAIGNVSSSQEYNTALTAPELGGANGYTFTGWSPEPASNMPAENTTYTAQWSANQYTVTLDANGGVDGATTSVNTTFGQAMPTIAAANLPTREGYRFDGFYTGKTDGTKYYNADGTGAKNQERYSADQKLYAHWVAQTTFSVNGSIVPALTIDDNAAMPSADVPTDCGDCWAFLGWSTDDEEDEAAEYASGDTHTFGTPTTLYAVFGQVEYKLITSTSGLVANDNYVITYWYISADTEYEYALSNTAHGTWPYDATATSVIDLARINADGDFLYNVGSNNIWKFTGTSSSGQLYNAAADKYLNLSSTSACMLNTTDNLTFTVVDDIYWKINSTNNLRFYTNPLFEADASKYSGVLIYHQVSSTVSTTPSCETYDLVWKVGNDEASGTPTDNTTTCTGIEELPDDPDDDALDCATKFMGWSESILTGEGKSAPADLFTTAGGAPKIDEDKTFHAVFASIDTESEESASITSTFTSTTWGDENSLWSSDKAATNTGDAKGVQVNKNESGAGATTKDSYNKVSSVVITYGSASSAAGSIAVSVGGTAMTLSSGSISGGQSDQTLTYTPTAPATYLSGVVSFVATVTNKSIYIKSIQINYKSYGYKDYMTICCDKSITIGTPSITGSGTVTFTLGGESISAGDEVETCTSAKDVVATVTPASGYSCTAVSFSGGSVSVDPTPGAGNYPSAPSTQDYTLSFAKETTSATLSTSATFTAKALTAWVWKYKKGNVGGADPASVIPDVVEAYIGEYVRFVIDGYTPSDVIAAKQGYVYDQDANPKQPVYNTDSLAHVGHSTDYYTTRGKVAGTATLKFKAVGDASITKTMTILTKVLPSVTFVDIVHNKTDFTNWGTDGVVSSTVTSGVVTHTKPTPTHSDVSDPGSNYNSCERNHIHLVGWIRSDWADEHPSATHSQITSVGDDDAGNPYFYTAGADIDIEAQNGKTFYAVWSKIE